jgi:glycosyltransferase involved in cell wall biosynthesis
LALELRGLESKVLIIVSDNGSTDLTNSVTELFEKKYTSSMILQQAKNLGPDENFCRCIDHVKSKYFWMIGDDDLPKAGVLEKIIKILEQEDQDIIYMNSEWKTSIYSANDGKPISSLSTKVLSREDFARQVNVWTSFISSMIINLDRLKELNPEINIRRFSGTNLVQLGWVLPLLMTGKHFCYIKQPCILATSGNSGGYQLLTVFGKKFIEILESILGHNSIEYKSIIRILIWGFLPGLIWKSRFDKEKKNFSDENISKILKYHKSKVAYWILLLPLQVLPKPFAFIFFIFSKTLWKLEKRFQI